MKFLFLLTIIHRPQLISMTENYGQMDYNIPINENSHLQEEIKKQKYASRIYMVATFFSLINLILVIYNYVSATEDNRNYIGLIVNILHFIFNGINILIEEIKFFFKILFFIFFFLLSCFLYLGFYYEVLYGYITANYQYNEISLGMIFLYTINYILFFLALLLNTSLSINQILCILFIFC